MKISEVYIPYHNTINFKYNQRLILEIPHTNMFRFSKVEENIPGTYNRLQRKNNIISQSLINHKLLIGINPISFKPISKILMSEEYKNISVSQIDNCYLLTINFFSDINLRDKAYKDIDYMYFIAERFKEFIEGDDFKKRKLQYQERQKLLY